MHAVYIPGTVQYILHTVECTLYIVQIDSTMHYFIQLYIKSVAGKYTMSRASENVYSVQFTVYIVHCCTVYSVYYTLYPVDFEQRADP